jgi:glycosyltransferase involved in cell wall biosynthesis
MRIALVTSRYGSKVIGGAEALARTLTNALAQRGWSVEVWTSCSRDQYTWRNDYEPGIREGNGLTLRRFPVTAWDPAPRQALDEKLRLNDGLNEADEYAWIDSGPHCLPLYSHANRYAADFDLIMSLPYLSTIAYYSAWIDPERTVLWPCLHRETLATLMPFRLLLETVRAVVFNTPEEEILARRGLCIQPRQHLVAGIGVNEVKEYHVGASQEQAHTPYLVYSGRLEQAKNLGLLYEYVQRYYDDGRELRLVLTGEGPYQPPDHPAFEPRGFVSSAEKAGLFAGALALCQPSLKESFSLVIMESWLAGRPVLVHQLCPVTKGHVVRSQGGLWFRTYGDFAGAIEWFKQHQALAGRMGTNGRAYVQQNYTWDRVFDRLATAVSSWVSSL